MAKTAVAAGHLPSQKTGKLTRVLWLQKNWVVEIIALLFVILFLYTGISKLMEYSVFKQQIAESPVLKPIAPLIAWALPITEFIVSLVLFIPRTRLKGLYAALILMILFTGYVIAIVSFSDKLPCSCGGILEQLSWQGHIAFNVAFTGLAALGIVMAKRLARSAHT